MKKKLNAEEILVTLTRLRKPVPDDIPAQTEEDFEYAAIRDTLQSLAKELEALLEAKKARMLEECLEIYYAAEKQARNPANACLIPYIEAMRRAYERQYGRPIPEREEE